MTGTIKRLVSDRGFGFIQPTGASEDIFFHTSAVANGLFDSLREGQQVEFDTERDTRDAAKTRGINVRVATVAQ